MDNQQPEINGRDQFAASFHKTLAALAAEAQSARGSAPADANTYHLPASAHPFAGITGPPRHVHHHQQQQQQQQQQPGMPSVLAGLAPPSLIEGMAKAPPAQTSTAHHHYQQVNNRYPPGGMPGNTTSNVWPSQMSYSAVARQPPQQQGAQRQQVQKQTQPVRSTSDFPSYLQPYLLAAVQIQSMAPGATIEQFRKRLEDKMGTLPEGFALPIEMPREAHFIIRNYPNAEASYRLLQQALSYKIEAPPRQPPLPPPGRSNIESKQQQVNRPSSSSRPQRTVRPSARLPDYDEDYQQPPPTYVVPGPSSRRRPAPEKIEVACNDLRGTFWVENQVITCHCQDCAQAAASAGLEGLAMSPNEFERHAGLAGSRKWKFTIRALEGRNPTIGKWLESYGIAPKPTKPIGLVKTFFKPTGEKLPSNANRPRFKPPRASLKDEEDEFDNDRVYDEEEEEEELDGFEEGGSHQHQQQHYHNQQQQHQLAGRPASRRRKPPTVGGPSAGQQQQHLTPIRPISASYYARNGAASEERPGLRSPTGKPWFASPKENKWAGGGRAGKEIRDVRVGDRFQANVPPYIGPPPKSVPSTDLTRVGAPAPDASAALASASGPELQQAQHLPRDATKDVWMSGAQARSNVTATAAAAATLSDAAGTAGDGSAGKGGDRIERAVTRALGGGGAKESTVQVQSSRLGGGRIRRPPGWMTDTLDPNAVLGGKALIPRPGEEEDALVGNKRSLNDDLEGQYGGKRARQVPLSSFIDPDDRPEMTYWRLTDGGQLSLTVRLGAVTFRGMIPAAHNSNNGTNIAAAGGGKNNNTNHRSHQNRDVLQAQYTTPASAGGLGVADPNTNSGDKPKRGRPVGSRNKEGGWGEVFQTEAGKRTEERRRQTDAEYERLLAEGPPPEAKCGLCHSSENVDIPDDEVGEGGRSQVGLGKLMLVRVSALNNAWVHEQCARWSPEVYDPTGEGILEGVDQCIRRGRMIRCKTCNEKGATLGCLKKTCKASYHLSCARRHGCLLQLEPYIVACPEHVNQLPAEVMRAKRAKALKRGTSNTAVEESDDGRYYQEESTEDGYGNAGYGGGDEQQYPRMEDQRYELPAALIEPHPNHHHQQRPPPHSSLPTQYSNPAQPHVQHALPAGGYDRNPQLMSTTTASVLPSNGARPGMYIYPGAGYTPAYGQAPPLPAHPTGGGSGYAPQP